MHQKQQQTDCYAVRFSATYAAHVISRIGRKLSRQRAYESRGNTAITVTYMFEPWPVRDRQQTWHTAHVTPHVCRTLESDVVSMTTTTVRDTNRNRNKHGSCHNIRHQRRANLLCGGGRCRGYNTVLFHSCAMHNTTY